MTRPALFSHLTSKRLWQRAGVAFIVAAPIILLAAYTGQEHTAATPITAPHPLATTTDVAPGAFMGLALTGKAAVVYDLTTGQTLYSQNADLQLPLASLTKLLSIYAGLKTLAPGTPITISSSSLAVEGESGFFAGETFAFSELARFALVASSNDAAEAIAETVAAQRSQTKRQALAGAAAAAGLTKTYAVNGSGLDIDLSTSGGYGSARDVAKLAGALVTASPELAEATAHPSVTIRDTQGVPHTLSNTNQEAITVPGILLSKTGYTDLAGGNLVVVFDAGMGHPVAAVVLGSTKEGRFEDVDRLIRATHAYFAGISR